VTSSQSLIPLIPDPTLIPACSSSVLLNTTLAGVDHRHLSFATREFGFSRCAWGGYHRTGCCRASPAALCRTDTQSATAVPDPVLGISRCSSALPKPRGPKHLVILASFFLSNRRGSRGSEAHRPRRFWSRFGGCGGSLVAESSPFLCPAATLTRRRQVVVRERQIGQDLALCWLGPCLIGLPLVTALLFGAPVTFEMPELKGCFNFSGGFAHHPGIVAADTVAA